MKTKIPYFIICILLILLVFNYAKGQQPNASPTNQPIAKEVNQCMRTTPYAMPPEFVRAMSLVNQRNKDASKAQDVFEPFLNCLDIQYSDLSDKGAEGYFLFDPNSSIQDLKIYVSKNYKSYDDILTATLLSHEVRHAIQFIDYKTKGTSQSCVEKEVDAFSWELAFLSDLNFEERKSLYNRVAVNPNSNTAYWGVWQLILIYDNTMKTGVSTLPAIKDMIITNPFYQEECGL